MAFTNRKDAREAGWFSRRHRTSEKHLASTEAWKLNRGPAARRRRAERRVASR
jgi:hypothetical protein